MTIATLSDYRSAAKQVVTYTKTGSGSNSNLMWISMSLQLSGNPAAFGSISNITTGVVPTASTTGAIAINAFSGTGYITRVECTTNATAASGSGRVMLYDRLFHAGQFDGTTVATTSLSSQPSFSSRVPGGNYTGLQLWAEVTVGGSGAAVNNTMYVNYTDQSGNTGHQSGNFNKPNNVAGPLVLIPLASGDCGVQKLESFTVSATSNNSNYNVFIARPLVSMRVEAFSPTVVQFIDRTGMPIVYQDSCLAVMYNFDSSTSLYGLDMSIEIASA